MSSSEVLRIGQLASRTGVSPDTIRLYERMGLLQKTPRTSGGYRLFPTDSIERVRLIRDAVRVGFSLRQLSTFLKARRAGGAPCHDVRDAAADILEAIDKQIADLTSTREAIRAMLDDWDSRLAATSPGRPAHLLDSLGTTPALSTRGPASNLRRRR
jgi:DNA-binding transcriptional MerR regulator